MTRGELIAAWVAALRSGEYEQGQGRLRVGEKLCCLAVACEVINRTQPGRIRVERLPLELSGAPGARVYSYGGDTGVLSEDARKLLGLKERAGDYQPGGALSRDNDQSATFAAIAATIESRPPGLFDPALGWDEVVL